MRALQRIDRGLAKVEEVLLFAILLGLLALAVFQVGWRNVIQPRFGQPPMLWADEILKHGTFVLGLLGASLATHADKQISLDVFQRLLARRKRIEAGARVIVRLATILVCFLLLRAGWEQVGAKEEAIDAVLHPWQWQLAIPIAFALLLAHFAFRLAYDLAALAGRPAAQDGGGK